MAEDNWNACLTATLSHEGGFVHHPRDPGGATNLGITRATLADWRGRPVSVDEVRALTVEEAARIYRARYWSPLWGDHLPHGFDLVAFDAGVNSGIRRGARWLQEGVGAAADGIIGPKTLEAARAWAGRARGSDAIVRACAARMSFLEGLRNWSVFGRGWSRRVAAVEAEAVRMWVEAGKFLNPGPALEERAREAEAEAGGKKAAAGASAGAGGGAVAVGETTSALPTEALVVIGLIVAFAAAVLWWRGRHDAERARAYRKEAERT